MSNFYCKYCGKKSGSIVSLVSGSCPKGPSKRHELYQGTEKKTYTCIYCGKRSGSIVSLVSGSCPKNPAKRHEPAL